MKHTLTSTKQWGRRLLRGEFPRHTLFSHETPLFKIKVAPNNKGENRWAIIIGNRVVKKAVHRHLLKRQITHILASWPPLGLDIIVMVKSTNTLPSFKKIQLTLQETHQYIISRL